jgi:hypothetical protein
MRPWGSIPAEKERETEKKRERKNFLDKVAVSSV